jgi:mycothiol synthase
MSELPSPPILEHTTFRPAVESDVSAILALQDACFEADRTFREAESEILDRFDDPGIDPRRDSLIAVTVNGDVIASVWSIVSTSAATMWRAFGEIHVHPDHRTGSMLAFAQEWWEARSRQRLALIDDDLDKVLWMSVYEHETERIAFLEDRGYTITRYYDELIRDLSRPIAAHPLPNDVTVVPAEEAGSGDDLVVHNAAFRDHWGSQPFTQERWDHFKNEFYLPGSSWVAYDGDIPVGQIMCAMWPQDFEDRGFRHSWILSLGVIRSHRKIGLASALITLALEDFVANDMEYALLDVDSGNETGAYGLYESLGFVRDRRSVALLLPA